MIGLVKYKVYVRGFSIGGCLSVCPAFGVFWSHVKQSHVKQQTGLHSKVHGVILALLRTEWELLLSCVYYLSYADTDTFESIFKAGTSYRLFYKK